MSADAAIEECQVDVDHRAFRAKLSEPLATHAGKLASMHGGDIVDFFGSYADAVTFGVEKFGEIGTSSVREATDRALSMGL